MMPGTKALSTTGGSHKVNPVKAMKAMLGHFDVRQREVDQVQGTILNFADSDCWAVPVIDDPAGVSWTCYRWQLAGGYEMTTWFNVGKIERALCDLILDGFFLRLSYSY